jgi:hypothetical protein
MNFSRRDFFAGAGGAALFPFASQASALQLITPLPFGQSATRSSPLMRLNAATSSDPTYSQYSSTLVNGYTPQFDTWNGIRWKCAMGSEWNPNMDYCWRTTPNKSRFELHNTSYDRAQSDESYKRRCEIHANNYPLPNGVSLWGAYSFIDHSWSDPLGMSKLQGGAHSQMHMPKGGSPAFAFRRYRTGEFVVTTCGANDPVNNHQQYRAALSFDQVHDLVFRTVIDPLQGELDVWLDRKQILSLRGASIGESSPGCYWCIGLYYGAICCPIVCEKANHVFPSTNSLLSRTSSSPAWPTS